MIEHLHNFYYTDEIKIWNQRQNEGNIQEATETLFVKPKSQAQQKKQSVKFH